MRWDLPGAGTDGHPASRGDVRGTTSGSPGAPRSCPR
jgi:hypothetical protein